MELNSILTKPSSYPELRGRVALVTGGGRGIGRAIAQRLAAEGMNVIICGRHADPLAETIQLISENGGRAEYHLSDLTRDSDISALVEVLETKHGGVDAIVHNAMQLKRAPLDDLPMELWEESFAIGCRGPFLLTRGLLPSLRRRGHGSIVFISSVGGARAHRPGLPYDAVKGAVDAMTRILAVELAPLVRVNSVAPGRTARLSHTKSMQDLANPHLPLQRAGSPAESASAVAFLISDQASYITGQILYIDGGLLSQLTPPGIQV